MGHRRPHPFWALGSLALACFSSEPSRSPLLLQAGHWSPRWAILGEPREEGERPCGASHFNPILQGRSMWTLNCDFSFKNKKKRDMENSLSKGKESQYHFWLPSNPNTSPFSTRGHLCCITEHFAFAHICTPMLMGLTTAAMTSFERSSLLRSLNLG